MKKLEIEKMEKLAGGKFDCSTAGQYSFVAGATAGGAIFFGWGGCLTFLAAAAYVDTVCNS